MPEEQQKNKEEVYSFAPIDSTAVTKIKKRKLAMIIAIIAIIFLAVIFYFTLKSSEKTSPESKISPPLEEPSC